MIKRTITILCIVVALVSGYAAGRYESTAGHYTVKEVMDISRQAARQSLNSTLAVQIETMDKINSIETDMRARVTRADYERYMRMLLAKCVESNEDGRVLKAEDELIKSIIRLAEKKRQLDRI